MSFSFQRGTFSLSKSNESPRQQSSPDLSAKFVNTRNLNSLELILKAAEGNTTKMSSGSGQQAPSAAAPSSIKTDQQSSAASAMELQQALQLSMASQNQQAAAAHPSALFATNRLTNPTNTQSSAQLMTQLQAQLLAGGQVNANPAAAAAVFAPTPTFASAPAVAQAPQAQANNVIIDQLVASLQAQQQAQQQVQVQAALARAFGPGGGGGLSAAAGFAAPQSTPLGNLGGMASISQPSAQDILSRLQLVQGNNGAAAALNADDLVKLQLAQNQQQSQQTVSLTDQMNGFKTVGLLNQQVSAFSNNILPGLNNTSQGAIIVPCRARGMPVDHNFKTAYFVIPDGIEHGDELVCSYPSCRQAGVKFRYCLHCKVPVAKRNFRNRHRHGVPGGDGGSDSGEDDASISSEEEGTAEDNDGKLPASKDATEASKDDDDEYSGVKKGHLLIIPGVDKTPDQKKKKNKKNKRVPCRARGMPMAHNFKTAYFILPDNIQHGDELECSFPSCRSAGAKFRYCLHCKVPVAKRNFRNRHKHGNMGDKKRSPSGQVKESGSAPKASEQVCLPVATAAPPPVMENVDEKQAGEGEGDLKPSSIPKEEPAVAAPTKSEEDPANSVSINTEEDAGKVQSWVSLLENKPHPDNKEAMTEWMMKVMNASNSGSTVGSESKTREEDASQPHKKRFKSGSDDE